MGGEGGRSDAVVHCLREGPRQRGAAGTEERRGGRSGDKMGWNAAVHREKQWPLVHRRAARRVANAPLDDYSDDDVPRYRCDDDTLDMRYEENWGLDKYG